MKNNFNIISCGYGVRNCTLGFQSKRSGVNPT